MNKNPPMLVKPNKKKVGKENYFENISFKCLLAVLRFCLFGESILFEISWIGNVYVNGKKIKP